MADNRDITQEPGVRHYVNNNGDDLWVSADGRRIAVWTVGHDVAEFNLATDKESK